MKTMRVHYVQGGRYTHRRAAPLAVQFTARAGFAVCGWDMKGGTTDPSAVTCKVCLRFLEDWHRV